MDKLFFTRICTILLVLFLQASCIRASHTLGGNVTYECVGPNQYVVTMTLFENCATAFESSANKNLTVTNNCGYTNPSASLPNIVYQQEISPLCPAQLGSSSCNGGGLPGVWMHQWQDTITLPGCCDSWTFGFADCCLNTTVNVVGQPGYYWETVMNSCSVPCNTSTHMVNPIGFYTCINQPVYYNLGLLDTNGDSLHYEFVSAQISSSNNVAYNAGYSATSPIPGISIDPVSGDMTFFASVAGGYIITVKVSEYNSAGVLAGYSLYYMQFQVVSCTNQTVNATIHGSIDSLTGGTLTGSNSIEMCASDSISFQISFNDPDPGDSLSFVSDILSQLPGATWQIVYPGSGTGQYDSSVIYITWNPVAVSSNSQYSFTVQVGDNACPVSGIISKSYTINVLGVPVISGSTALCDTGWLTLTADAYLATSYSWTITSGDPIIVGTNINCDTCSVVQVKPSVSTTYQVFVNSQCSQGYSATHTVAVPPDYIYNVSLSDSTICYGSSADISITVIPSSSGHSYQWFPAFSVSGDTLFSPGATGNYYLSYIATGPEGCTYSDSIAYTHFGPQGSTENITACNSYIWPLNGTTYTNGGIYDTTVPNSQGCDSLVILSLTINQVNVSTTLIGLDTLKAVQNNAVYQWLDCNNNYLPVSGANQQVFVPSVNGSYAVSITYNGCTDTSACMAVNGIGIAEQSRGLISVYPNPASDYLTVENLSGNPMSISMNDLGGKLVYDVQVQGGVSQYRLVMENIETGIYLIRIECDQTVFHQRVLINK